MQRPFGVVLLLVAACEPAAEPPPQTPTAELVPAESEVAAGSSSQVYQGRIALGSPAESWIEVEVMGPARDARWACETLVESERARIESAGGSVQVLRPCSDAALEPAPATRPWAIAISERWDAATLALELGTRGEGHDIERLRVRRAELSMFTDEGSCRGALEKIESARAEARAQAHEKAVAFVERSREQRGVAQKACASPKSTGCGNARELERVLESKLQRAARDPGRRLRPGKSCFRRVR